MNLKNIETYRLAGYQEKTVTGTVNTFALELIDQFITIDATIGAAAITLPPVVAAVGRIYSFRKSDSSAYVVTVVGAGDEIIPFSNVSLDGLNATLMVFSDGTQWFEMMALAPPAVLALVDAATTLLANQQVVTVANTQAVTITLPAVAAAKGRIYTIHKISADAFAVTVASADGDVAYSNATLDAENDRVALFSDGRQWYEVGAAIA